MTTPDDREKRTISGHGSSHQQHARVSGFGRVYWELHAAIASEVKDSPALAKAVNAAKSALRKLPEEHIRLLASDEDAEREIDAAGLRGLSRRYVKFLAASELERRSDRRSLLRWRVIALFTAAGLILSLLQIAGVL